MGPDCGTAILDGVPLGFANVVRRGSIGLVGASGTGLQQVSCLIDRFGAGVSQAIGVGGRDLDERVGGTMMLAGLERLAADPGTARDRPHLEAAGRVGRRRGSWPRPARAGKPVVVNFLGGDPAGDHGPPERSRRRRSKRRREIASAIALGRPIGTDGAD